MKKALIVGINYVGTPNELRGCINDAQNMQHLLSTKFGFSDIKMVLEKDATTDGILDGLRWLVAGAVPGDVLVFHYSGHGSQIRSNIEPDGLDEIICPIDLNWRDKVIKDDDMKAILGEVPNGVNITVILDCCHSGTALDQDETLFAAKVMLQQGADEAGGRFMPMPEHVEDEIEANALQIREFKTSRDINRSALLIAGCQSTQTSADAFLENQPQGAATCALRFAVNAGCKTYREIAVFMTDFMVRNGFTQRPQLDGHPSLYDQAFLEPFGTAEGTPTATPAPGTWVEPVVSTPQEDHEASVSAVSQVALAFLIVAAVVLFVFIF